MAWLALAQTVSGLGLPLLATRRLDRRPWMGLAIAMQLAGFGGLWLAPTAAPILWCMLCGAGLGGSFSSSWSSRSITCRIRAEPAPSAP